MSKPNSIRYDWVSCVIDGVIARRVQTLGSTTDFTTENLLELGDLGFAETTTDPAVTVTIDTNDWGTTNTFALLANVYNKENTASLGGYKGSAGDNSYVVDQTDFENAAVDITAPVSEDGTNLDRTLHLGYCFLNSISLNYDVGGVATENYTLETDVKRWYLNDHKAVAVYEAYHDTTTQAVISGANLGTGYTGLMVTVNGVIISDELTATGRPGLGSTITLTDSGADTNVTSSTPALSLAAGDRIRVIVSQDSSETYTFLSSTPSGLGGAQKGHVEIVLSDQGNQTAPLGSSKSLRVQTVAIDVDLSREVLEELGNDRAYSRSIQTPVPITATLTVNDSDLEMWADLSQLTWDANLDELDILDFVKDSILEVRIFKDKTDHTIDTSGAEGTTAGSNTLLKVVRLEGCAVSGESHSVSTGGIAQQEFTLTAETFIMSGTGLSPLV
jgi:hypothetical protein